MSIFEIKRMFGLNAFIYTFITEEVFLLINKVCYEKEGTYYSYKVVTTPRVYPIAAGHSKRLMGL